MSRETPEPIQSRAGRARAGVHSPPVEDPLPRVRIHPEIHVGDNEAQNDRERDGLKRPSTCRREQKDEQHHQARRKRRVWQAVSRRRRRFRPSFFTFNICHWPRSPFSCLVFLSWRRVFVCGSRIRSLPVPPDNDMCFYCRPPIKETSAAAQVSAALVDQVRVRTGSLA